MVLMTTIIGTSIGKQFERLKTSISGFNRKGDLQGLFSCHVLSGSPEFDINWTVTCDDKDWLDTKYNKGNLYHLAALGYSIYISEKDYQQAQFRFLQSLEVIKKRNHFNGSHMSFPFQPITFLGMVLGVKSISDNAQRHRHIDWLISVLNERKQRGKITSFHSIFYKYIESQLDDRVVTIDNVKSFTSLEDLSFIEWGRRMGCFQLPEQPEWLDKSRDSIIHLFVRIDLDKIDPMYSSLIWFSANKAVSKSVDDIIVSPSHLSALLNRFPSAMKRWRYNDNKLKDPIKWLIKGEREVQDIVWLMLRPYFEDLIDEESLPKLGHSAYKPDFAIPSLSTLLEVKYVRKKADFKKVEKEILEDSVAYLAKTKQYKRLLVFIYDHSCSVQEYEETRRDLINVKNIADVIIVPRPSQLPSEY